MAGIEIKKKALLSSVVGEEEANLGHLCGEIVKEIVDRIPVESLARMKLLSRGWYRLISDKLIRSKTQPSSSPARIDTGIPPCSPSSPVMEQQVHKPYPEGHSVDAVGIERERIRELAILKHLFPSLYPARESNESNADGVCQWCLQKFNHTRDECPAGDLTFHPYNYLAKEVTPPPLPRRKEKGEVKILLEGEVDDVVVRKLMEPFGALRRVRLHELRLKDAVFCSAIVAFVNVDDAEKAVKKLKGDGYNIRLYD